MLFEKIKCCLSFLYNKMGLHAKIVGIFIFWLVIHHLAAHLYVYFCTPFTMIGFVMSPMLIPAQHCQALRWLIYNGGNSIIGMWLLFAAWILQFIQLITYEK
jgi:hypothetical protein